MVKYHEARSKALREKNNSGVIAAAESSPSKPMGRSPMKVLLDEYSELFDGKLACIKGAKTCIMTKPDVDVKKFSPARKNHLHKRKKLRMS